MKVLSAFFFGQGSKFSDSAKIEKSGENYTTVWNPSESATQISLELPTDNYAGDSVTIELVTDNDI